MALWKDVNGNLHDDMDGEALSLPNWPQGAIELTAEEAAIAQQPQKTVGSVCDSIDSYCDSHMNAGFSYLGAVYQVDADSQRTITSRATYAVLNKMDAVTFPWNTPYSDGWKDAENVWHAMTGADFLAFAKAVSDFCSACYKCCSDHKAAVTTLNYATYDYSTGWPSNVA